MLAHGQHLGRWHREPYTIAGCLRGVHSSTCWRSLECRSQGFAVLLVAALVARAGGVAGACSAGGFSLGACCENRVPLACLIWAFRLATSNRCAFSRSVATSALSSAFSASSAAFCSASIRVVSSRRAFSAACRSAFVSAMFYSPLVLSVSRETCTVSVSLVTGD